MSATDSFGQFMAAPRGRGAADVVGITVRQDHAFDVVERASHRRESRAQFVPVAGELRIDDGHTLGGDVERAWEFGVARIVEAITATASR